METKNLISAALVFAAIGLSVWVGNHRGPRESVESIGAHETPRSPKWPAVRAEYLKTHPTCEVCGGRTILEVHHVQPFHLRPDLELDPDNLITLCGRESCKSHLAIGHLGNYQLYNPDIRSDAALLRQRRQDARKAAGK